MSLDKVVECLKALPLGRRENSPTSSDESDSSQSSDASESRNTSKSKDTLSVGKFFCIEDTFATNEIKVSVDNVGLIKFPIQESTIKKLISVSEKAKYGRGTKTILDTSYRDTQTIPASKLKVEINQECLKNVLNRVEAELNIAKSSKLEVHLYNMLIYGEGQFFKKHRDSEKVENMVATSVIVLPSSHTGGDLIIHHNGSKHKFFGSLNHNIIKCVTFFADCYHEVKEVTDGYRVALTYNVAVKSETIFEGVAVNENLRKAVNSYFRTEKADYFVYYLDHQYTEQSLRWYLLKGSDQTRAKALFAVAKKEGYVPCLALARYHESWDQECEDEDQAQIEIDLYSWIDENNQSFKNGLTLVYQSRICCTKDTKECFEPESREEEGPTGNEGNYVNQWYQRSCVVIWKSSWSFLHGYKKEVAELHKMTSKAGMKNTLLQKIKDNEKVFLKTRFWIDRSGKKDDTVKNMIFDILIYLSDMEMTAKILKNFNPSDVFDLGKLKMVTWISSTWNIELWKDLIAEWKSHNPENLLGCGLLFLEKYMKKKDRNIEIAEYLLNEISDLFIKSKKDSYVSFWMRDENDKKLSLILQICQNLGNLDVEENVLKNFESSSSFEDKKELLKFFEKELHPDHFARISEKLLLNMGENLFKEIKKESNYYIYSKPKITDIDKVCSLLKNAIRLQNKSVEAHILHYIMSDPAAYSASFLAELFVNMKNVLGNRVNYYTAFRTHVSSLINEELGKLNNANDWKLPLSIPCNCQYCRHIQAFFVSTTLNKVNFMVAEKNREHISNYLRDLKHVPIHYDYSRAGNNYKFTVTKLPKLEEDRRNFIKRLMICRKIIVEMVQRIPGNSAAKKAKV